MLLYLIERVENIEKRGEFLPH